MLKPTLIIENDAEFERLCLEGGLLGHLIEVECFNSKERTLVNLTGKDAVADQSLQYLRTLVSQNIKSAFKAELVKLLSKLARGKKGFLVAPNINSNIDKLFEKYALRSPYKRQSARGYFKSMDEEQRLAELKVFVDELLEIEHWADSFPMGVIELLPVSVLPAFVLSVPLKHSEMKLEKFFNNLWAGVEFLSRSTARSVCSAKALDESDNEWLWLSDSYIRSLQVKANKSIRNVELSIFRFGVIHKLWLKGGIPSGVRLQGRVLVPSDLNEAFDVIFYGRSDSRSNLSTIWSRFCLLARIVSVNQLPHNIATIAKYVFRESSQYNSSKMLIAKIVSYVNEAIDASTQVFDGQQPRYTLSKIPIHHASTLSYSNDLDVPKVSWYEAEKLVKYDDGRIAVWSKDNINRGWQVIDIPEEWRVFIKEYYNLLPASDDHKKDSVYRMLEWALMERNFESPWQITAADINPPPFSESDRRSWYDFINERPNASAKKTKVTMWNSAVKMFRLVCNNAALSGNKKNNPFKYIETPIFKGKKSSAKTPRKRINQAIIDEMLEVLCEPDSNKIPTYKWAEKISLKAKEEIGGGRTDHFNKITGKSTESVFCPSRAAALALLLTIPLRGVQVRWLDEGLFDDKIYDPDSGSFIDNYSDLKNWRNEAGQLNTSIIGGNTGVIQSVDYELVEQKFLSIYVNTNKTQLWNPSERSGYSIPWPYIENPSSEKEKDLNLPYAILKKQLAWVREYAKNPTPLRFDLVNEDKKRLTNIDSVIGGAPFFVPLFRDMTSRVSYRLNKKQYEANPPISKQKLETLFDELCLETEKRLVAKNYDVKLTKKVKGKVKSIFDIHTLRVAGISNLIEMGVPVNIVSEFVAGHLTVAMTHHYDKADRDKIKDSILDANNRSGAEKVFNKPEEAILIQPISTDSGDLITDKNIAAFASVEGGICPLGGKGCDGCKIGMKTQAPTDNQGKTKEIFTAVVGGCGNCRFWTTGPDFIPEQALEMNRLMIVMREDAREILALNNTIEDLEWELEDAPPEEAKLISVRIMNIKSDVESRENALAPKITAWSNRYQAILDSEDARKSAIENEGKLTLLNADIESTLEQVSDFELVRRTVDQALMMPRGTVPMPENPARMLREFMDAILVHSDSPLLFAGIRDKELSTRAASMLANSMVESIGWNKVDEVLEGEPEDIPPTLKSSISEAVKLVHEKLKSEHALDKQNKLGKR